MEQKELSRKLGAAEKKINDQKKEIARLQEQNNRLEAIMEGLHMASDMLMIHVAMIFGEKVKTKEKDGELVIRMNLPPYEEGLLEKYRLDVWPADCKDGYIVGVTEKAADDA